MVEIVSITLLAVLVVIQYFHITKVEKLLGEITILTLHHNDLFVALSEDMEEYEE